MNENPKNLEIDKQYLKEKLFTRFNENHTIVGQNLEKGQVLSLLHSGDDKIHLRIAYLKVNAVEMITFDKNLEFVSAYVSVDRAESYAETFDEKSLNQFLEMIEYLLDNY
ncbi:hypothetical protein GF340_00060 [Candidatus Peregrinibacteria bacterium]|nr:hypothetical protein [Candidatus Peregrinibacteria bacterium]